MLFDDRLEGRITGAFYDQKAAQIESQQTKPHRATVELDSATLPPLTNAVALARLTRHADTVFRDQQEPEQGKFWPWCSITRRGRTVSCKRTCSNHSN
jgi:hypothetical protein